MQRFLSEVPSITERIQRKLAVARHVDYFREYYGADVHDYALGACLSDEAICEVEKAWGILIPTEYHHFLREVGNGGNSEHPDWPDHYFAAGPGEGLYSFGDETQFESIGACASMAKPINIFFPEGTESPGALNLLMESSTYERVEGEDPEYRGLLPVSHGSSSTFTALCLSGVHKGSVIRIDPDLLDQGLGIQFCATDFLTWYEEWLDEVISPRWHRSTSPLTENDFALLLKGSIENSWEASTTLRLIGGLGDISSPTIDLLKQLAKVARTSKEQEFAKTLVAQFGGLDTEEFLSQASDSLFIHFLSTRDNGQISRWQNRLDKMRQSGQQEMIDSANFLSSLAE